MKKTFKSSLKRIFVIFLAFITLVSPCVGIYSFADESVDAAIKSKINSTYAVIRAKRGYSYNGYCGTYIKDQLNAVNVGFVINGGYNGNQWYPNLVEDAKTLYGYTQEKFGGNGCLYDIAKAYGNEVYNIVISFTHQYGYSDAYPGAGHAVYIYAMLDGTVYFSESYSSRNAPEGSAITMTVDDFMYKYNSFYGNALGAVYFAPEKSSGGEASTPDTTPEQTPDDSELYSIYYEIKNMASGKYLNVYGSRNYEGVYVNIYSRDYTTGEKFRIQPYGDSFRIFAQCAPLRALNMVDSKGQLNAPKEGRESDLWYLERLGGNRYVIRYKLDPDYVLTSSGSYNSSRVILEKYSPTNQNQIWEFSIDTVNEVTDIYTVMWDVDGKIYKQSYSYNQTPVCPVTPEKEGLEFIGWDKEVTKVTESAVYVATFDGGNTEYTVTFEFGGELYTESFKEGLIAEFISYPEISLGKPSYLMYDKTPEAVDGEGDYYKVYYVYEDENGTKYFDGKAFLAGWQEIEGGRRYFSKLTGYMMTGDNVIGGVLYKFNRDGTLYNGLYDIGEDTRYYIDGVSQRGWREIDGKLYYFFSSTGYMVKATSYVIGGLYREFNPDHSAKPVSGWQTKQGYKYYYENGEMVTGFKEIDGQTYYFLRSDDVYGQMASGWQRIGGKFYYFYAYGSENYGKMVKEDRNIGGSWHEFAEDGSLEKGFCSFDGSSYYMTGGNKASGWMTIDGKKYYFLKESGVMVTESRTIGGVWYQFSEDGVCLTEDVQA